MDRCGVGSYIARKVDIDIMEDRKQMRIRENMN